MQNTQQSQEKQHHHHYHHQPNNTTTPTTTTAMNSTTPPNTLQLTSRNYAPAESVTSDENELDYPEARYECAICIHWLNEPVLTSCGHRFCKSCLSAWMRKNNQCCPLDNKSLAGPHDIFPDKYTGREIGSIRFKCPNSPLGCSVVASPIEVDRHLPTCPYRRDELAEEKCPFASVKCDFIGRPQTNQIEEHLKVDMPHHMQLMLKAFQQTAIATWTPQKSASISTTSSDTTVTTNGHTATGPLPPPPQYANEANEQLIQAMYQRIVVLEQRAHEQDAKVENLTKQLTLVRQRHDVDVDPRYSNGTIIWEVNNFQNLIEHLRSNANNQVYSRGCYTSPYGYKFCARLNIQPNRDHLLSLHVHLMQSENDFHLDWPFKGRIKLCMIHPRDTNLSQHDTIMTKPEILAFHQPRERISTRGFGFVEYANINDIVQKGFCQNDRLLIKIQINIV